jgi:biotin carboxyl carrier protein
MKLNATIADYLTDLQAGVQIWDEGARVCAEIDGRRYELEVHESGPNGYLFISRDGVFECRVEGWPESGTKIDVIVGTTSYAVTITDPKRLRSAIAPSAHGSDAAPIIASMPGKVVRVLVEVGARVKAGDAIIVVEAMKMQNEMKSPKTGTVVALNIQTGATVNGGDVLAVVE